MDNLSIGNELRDAYAPTARWAQHGAHWLADIEAFYAARAGIEREYLAKLRDLARRHFDKKARLSAHLSVGDEPHITPGSLECALVVLWNEVLAQTEATAAERESFAQQVTHNVCRNVAALQQKCDALHRHIAGIHDFLELERKTAADEVARAKKHYDLLCQSTELARQKTERLASEKHQQRLAERLAEMNVGKNAYLISIATANRLKDKYYFQDLPEVLDYLQDLNELRVAVLNKLVRNAAILERNLNDKIKGFLHAVDATVEQNDPRLDTAMYVKHNAHAWAEPPDFVFVPCDFWHDNELLAVGAAELADLKRRLNALLTAYALAKDSTLAAKQRLEEAAQQRRASADAATLKFDAQLADVLLLLLRFMREDLARVRSEVEIELIQNHAGDKDMLYVEAKKEKRRFGLFKKHAHDTAPAAPATLVVPGAVFSLRALEPRASSDSRASLEPRATVLYRYAAQGDDEVSVEPGDCVDVVRDDDGGWTAVRAGGHTGLVPTLYLEPERKRAPPVAPKRGAKRVQYMEALYDYAAEEENELSIAAGERIAVVQQDTDGSGWTEGEARGQRGLFPTAYAKLLE